MTDTGRKAVVVGISGASSSGKTTLARLIRDIFPNTFVLHEDDFYKPEKDYGSVEEDVYNTFFNIRYNDLKFCLHKLTVSSLPTRDGLLDWDCAEALSIPDIVTTLNCIRTNGTFPVNFNSKEDRNSVGKCPVPEATVAALKAKVLEWTKLGNPGHGILNSAATPLRMCLFDGFLLYPPSMSSIHPQLDMKFFLRTSYATAKARREARSGYATIEGFWEDPPGYVEKIVWPNYVEGHKWMFVNGDVEGCFKKDVLREHGIAYSDESIDVNMETTVKWLVETLMLELENYRQKTG